MSILAVKLTPLDPTVNASAFDLNVDTSAHVKWDVRALSTVCIEIVKVTTWATAIFTLERSLDGVNWWPLETAETIAAGGGMSSTIDATAMAYIRARSSTLEGSQKFAVLTAFGKAGE